MNLVNILKIIPYNQRISSTHGQFCVKSCVLRAPTRKKNYIMSRMKLYIFVRNIFLFIILLLPTIVMQSRIIFISP